MAYLKADRSVVILQLATVHNTTANIITKPISENTYHTGKWHGTADLLFEKFGFDQTSEAVVNSKQAKQLILTK